MPKKIELVEIKRRLYHTHGNQIILVDDTYEAFSKKATFIHSIYGSWKTKVQSVINGSTHPKDAEEFLKEFSKSRRISIQEVHKRLFDIHGDSVSIINSTYKGFKKKATFVHKDGSRWEAYVYNVVNGTLNTEYHKDLLTKVEVENKIELIHGDVIKIVWESFVNTHTVAKFIHSKYGEFIAFPYSVFQGGGPKVGWWDKVKATNLKRYGVEFASQNKEIALKTAKSLNSTKCLKHWKTGEELVCQASYEIGAVNYLNTNKINYLWQSEVFITPILTKGGTQSTYRPDLFLIDSNTWVEIKGYFRKDAQEKWDWFKSKYPNSELWDKKKLKELGIL